MSQQEQLRLFLLNDPTPKEDFTVPRGLMASASRPIDFLFIAEETLQTAPWGRCARCTSSAPTMTPSASQIPGLHRNWDYLVVKATVHIEDGSPTEAMVTSASIDGRTGNGEVRSNLFDLPEFKPCGRVTPVWPWYLPPRSL